MSSINHAQLEQATQSNGPGGSASYGRVKTPGVDTTHGAILYLESISVVFDGFKALNDLSLDIGVGELRCIIGPNGAGKTTMMDVITGKTKPTSGTAFLVRILISPRCKSPRLQTPGLAGNFNGPPFLKTIRYSKTSSWR